ncbi:protein FAR1-RELATED SEQUENCE 7-like isoform X1 [Malus sylvestris]|uniref:protein FAR1-RELATED SEQUENCE 7-like isoform X1 n=1 Tax=Malus sylvestris TaxID=3752 RepID=UPI0021ABCBF8|nr:protein FAR1-RELATED SEQUENCE 7-like isoform X1 [Malus sylvestris]
MEASYAIENYRMTADPTPMESEADLNKPVVESSVERDVPNNESGEMLDSNNGTELIENDVNGILEPYVGMEFDSEEAVKEYYDAYATRVGFRIRVGNFHRSNRDGSINSRKFLCNKEGFRNNKKSKRGEVRRSREETREGCKAMIMARKEKSGKWVVTKLEIRHCHPMWISRGKKVTIPAPSQDEKDKKIRELSAELYRANQQLAECRKTLEMVLKEVDQHAYCLTKSVQNIVKNVKEIEDKDREKL